LPHAAYEGWIALTEDAMNLLLKLTSVVASATIAVTAFAQGKSDQMGVGRREFGSNCATCHGVSGKGNGPVAEFLKKVPPDLTVLAQKNNGVLPMARLYEILDGTGIQAHGTRAMPVWGRECRVQAAEH
jgi:mono/diheme cytochrome c family protein